MKNRLSGIVCILVSLLLASAAFAQQKIAFPSLDRDASGQPVTLDGYLYLPEPYDASKRYPGLVFMHGCSGLFSRSGQIMSREADWARRLSAQGYLVLAVDSFTTRNQSSECVRGGPVRPQVERPLDAYGALRFLQRREDVLPDRIGLIGWSHGGGTVLFAIGPLSPARQDASSQAHSGSDFRAAVAFYPGWCNDKAQRAAQWNTTVPLLILTGASDVWTRAAPCEQFVETVRAHGAPVELQVYPDAFHDFDFPHLPVRAHPDLTNPRTGVAPITGTNPAAREDAIERVGRYLADHLAQ
jgi:dienelactone hydrolase